MTRLVTLRSLTKHDPLCTNYPPFNILRRAPNLILYSSTHRSCRVSFEIIASHVKVGGHSAPKMVPTITYRRKALGGEWLVGVSAMAAGVNGRGINKAVNISYTNHVNRQNKLITGN